MTQFQIEGGGLVQGVTKLITIFFPFVTKTMPIELTKTELIHHILDLYGFSKEGKNKIQRPTKNAIFSLFLQKKFS